ncbi:MAG: prepilin-type N-terminal cleavage/methylation domain-containing protein [Bdellovibrionales bacterium]|nr:prepilin-type N-terminal cleavage/methylation domain-containing protein [Bdellovibrionales bacterium]
MKGFTQQNGFTMFELIMTLGLSLVISGIAAMNLKELDDPLKNGSAQLEGFFKLARAKATSSTSAYTVMPENSGNLITKFSPTCGTPLEEQVEDPNLRLEFPTGAFLADTDWTLCYDSRGLPDGNLAVEVYDQDGDVKTVQVYLGGGVRIE